MQACVTFPTFGAGLTPLTVTGVVDKDGAQFVGKAWFIYGNSVLNTIGTWTRLAYGMDDLTTRYATGFDETNEFGGKITSTGAGGGLSFIDERGSVFFGGAIERQAYISSASLGQYVITPTVNNRSGDSYVVLVLGGDDLQAKIGTAPTGNVFTVGFAAEAVIAQQQAVTSSPTTSGGSGGGLGWDTRSSNRGTASVAVVAQGGNARYQISTEAASALDLTTLGNVSQTRHISAWGATTFTVSGSGVGGFSYFALGGIKAAAGAALQPAAPGTLVIDTGIKVRAFLILSVDAPASASVRTDIASLCIGVADGTRVGCVWSGDATNGNAALTGARYVSNGHVQLGGTPNAGSTVFTSAAVSVTFVGTEARITWSAVSGAQPQFQWLALGEQVDPVVRLTQLPLEVAYDFGILKPYVVGDGALWATPPPPLPVE